MHLPSPLHISLTTLRRKDSLMLDFIHLALYREQYTLQRVGYRVGWLFYSVPATTQRVGGIMH